MKKKDKVLKGIAFLLILLILYIYLYKPYYVKKANNV